MDHPRILVAEDEAIIAMDLCMTVEEAGCRVEGPHRDVSSAMLALQIAKPDLAILDVQLSDGKVYPLARKLMEENVPVIFHSGEVSSDEMRAMFPDAIACEKPCPPNEILARVEQALAAH
ncbi:response regulator [Qipengyuania sp. JC766]|uniref:response regulator n=1 Tax=Qipengyuania sp. JC766 TaxID=3232139 RepID=UPI0034579ED9